MKRRKGLGWYYLSHGIFLENGIRNIILKLARTYNCQVLLYNHVRWIVSKNIVSYYNSNFFLKKRKFNFLLFYFICSCYVNLGLDFIIFFFIYLLRCQKKNILILGWVDIDFARKKLILLFIKEMKRQYWKQGKDVAFFNPTLFI